MKEKIVLCIIILLCYSAQAYATECSCVVAETQKSKIWNEVSQFISKAYNTSTLTIRSISRFGDWSLAEVESKDFEPMILLLKNENNKSEIKAEWGGMVESGNTGEVVSAYFIEKAPDAPVCLLRCYRPKGPPFLTK